MTIVLARPVNALASYHYFAKVDLGPLAATGLRIIADSGAYSAASAGTPVDLDAFTAWAQAQRRNVAWVASLDVIGDAARTWANYRRMRSANLDVVPTVHYGADPREVDRYAADGVDFVGLGGLVAHKSSADRQLRWCVQMFRYARDTHPGMRFHGWGVTHPTLLSNLPWWSVDSSGATYAMRYGDVQVYDPPRARCIQFKANGRDAYRHGDLLRRYYGIDPAAVATSGPHNARLLYTLGVRSLQLREQWLRARHRVTPPAYGTRPGPVYGTDPNLGTNVHYVVQVERLKALAEIISRGVAV